jgi:glycosyltransferase involved in cell wall biosynthesis
VKIVAAPKVSVIVPVYNTEKYLQQCIGSITSQTIREIEIIIVDDGSREECAVLCDSLAKTDDRIRVIHKENAGPGFARNTGIEAANGEYIGFVDSDDYIKPDMYDVLYNAALKNNADLVISGISFVGGNTFGKSGEYEEKHYFHKDTLFQKEDIKNLLLGVVGALPHEPDDSRYGVSTCKNLFKRSVITDKKIEFLSERKVMSEDAIFMIDFIKQIEKAVGIPGAFYCYRRNDESFSKSYRSDRFSMVQSFINELENHIKDVCKREEYSLYLNRLIQGYGRILCSQEIMYAKENDIKYSILLERLKMICKSEMISDALKYFPWYRLPKKQAAFAFAMKYKLYFLQKLMVIIRAR